MGYLIDTNVLAEIRKGACIPIADAIIAATAIVHDLTLVTRDTKDMNRTGVRILNPFGA